MKEMDTAFIFRPQLSAPLSPALRPPFTHTHAHLLSSFSLWRTQILVEKKLQGRELCIWLCGDPTIYMHGMLLFVHALSIYMAACHVHVLERCTHTHTCRKCVWLAFLYRGWNIKQNWEYLWRQGTRGGSNHKPHATLKDSVCERGCVCVCVRMCVSWGNFC